MVPGVSWGSGVDQCDLDAPSIAALAKPQALGLPPGHQPANARCDPGFAGRASPPYYAAGHEEGPYAPKGHAAVDAEVLRRARNEAQEEATRRLEQERLRLEQLLLAQDQERQSPGTGAAEPGRVGGLAEGCSGPARGPEGPSADGRRFTLLSSFRAASPVGGLAASGEGMVATAFWDGSVELFDVPAWQRAARFRAPAPQAAAAPAGAPEVAFSAAAFQRAGASGPSQGPHAPPSPLRLSLSAGRDVQLRRGDTFSLEATLSHSASVGALDFRGNHLSNKRGK